MNNFSIWCDFLEDSFLDNEFLNLIYSNTINGATTNPSIFKNAILNSKQYKERIARLNTKNAKQKYEILAIQDIKKAADKLSLNYFTNNEGFISIEIDPRLHDNTALSIGEAKRLRTEIAKDNVMIKIPATNESYEAMYELMKEGINVNATLIFSYEQSIKCFEALNLGLKEFRKKNKGLKEPKAVISVFVSRYDRLLNNRVLEKNKLGIYLASFAYHYIQAQNEANIKTLFASTGVKGDDLPKDYYIKEFLFKDCINTAPLDAIEAFKGKKLEFKEPLSLEELHQKLEQNISKDELDEASKFLLDDGLKLFCEAYEDILSAL
ncbi:transaldolase [Campylobacter avium]|uniref:transaldolase n=1 Tax=Campylobacter avium TaxID=522485 RepID=UPI002357792E|nr:transaldolase [Campylobacter avium]